VTWHLYECTRDTRYLGGRGSGKHSTFPAFYGQRNRPFATLDDAKISATAPSISLPDMKEWNFSNYKAVLRKNKELKAVHSEGMIIDPLSILYTSHFRDRFELTKGLEYHQKS
jgi:hypothetical protein